MGADVTQPNPCYIVRGKVQTQRERENRVDSPPVGARTHQARNRSAGLQNARQTNALQPNRLRRLG